MTVHDFTRTARVEARIAPDALAVVRRAAERQGRSLSDFMVAAALKDAQRTIEEAQIIRLWIDDQLRFAERLQNPPPLAPAMKRALEARKRLIVDAKDGAAEAFDLHHGFEAFGGKARRLYVPLGRFAREGG
jgi:uncharacterized protein (DUF1778 family)